MSIVRFSNPVVSPSLFNRFFDDDIIDWASRNFSKTETTLPQVNIRENTDAFVVEVAAPGFEKTDFKIEIDGDRLSIGSEKKIEKESKEGERFTKREFSYQSFTRSFILPKTANSDRIAANYDKGILEVSIPKREEAKPKPARMIELE